ncbi:MAG: RNA methyltransferase, partial [Thermoguttaceae bacterium]
DRTLRGESIFVTEGRLLCRRLLASRFEAESVFVSEEYAEEFSRIVPEGVPLLVAPEPLLLAVVGFKFHRGALAAGRRGPKLGLDEMLARALRKGTVPFSACPFGQADENWDSPPVIDAPLRLVVCPEITKPENMGLIFRTAAGLGLCGVLLGERSCDPFSRRCLRVSMGAVLDMPFVKSTDLSADLGRLADSWGVDLLAAVLDPAAETLRDIRWPRRAGVVFGNESEGLRQEWLALCPRRVTIPMHRSTDSLNLGVAAAIVMYEMMRELPLARLPDRRRGDILAE